MLPKLIAIIVIAGATACALLVNRQHRIDTANEIAVIHHRLLDQEQTLWRLRTDIAIRTRPDQIRKSVEAHGGMWVAIPAPPPPDRIHRKTERMLAQGPVEPELHESFDATATTSGL